MSIPCIGDVFLWTSGNMWDKSGLLNCVRCDGRSLKVADYDPLYEMLVLQGQIVRTPDSDTFVVPDLTPSAPSGLTPYIVAEGPWPPQPYDFTYYRVTDGTYTGEVDYSTDPYPPSGWADCDGSLIPISQNTTLYSILGNAFGGNGTTTFALPDVPGAVISLAGTYPHRD